jgi:hypothetical protein
VAHPLAVGFQTCPSPRPGFVFPQYCHAGLDPASRSGFEDWILACASTTPDDGLDCSPFIAGTRAEVHTRNNIADSTQNRSVPYSIKDKPMVTSAKQNISNSDRPHDNHRFHYPNIKNTQNEPISPSSCMPPFDFAHTSTPLSMRLVPLRMTSPEPPGHSSC